jgi:HD superfamily phosphohydrolase
MTDEDLKSMIEDVIKDMIETGELEAGHEGMEGEEGAEDETEEEISDEEIDLAELLREIEEIEEAEEVEEIESIDEAKKKKEKEDKKEDEDKKKMKKELDEAYSAIETLKDELNEINLLNAKLLYTNKIFKAKNLNESQKVKVLSSFDKAKNVGEVKMVFETLNEGIKVSKNTIKEHLGSASKGTITPSVKKPIVESNEAFSRMQKLAGII